MTIDKALQLFAFVTLAETMFYVGVTVSLTAFESTLRDPRLIARAVVANYLAVPALMVVLLLALDAPPLLAVGCLAISLCPGGAYGPVCSVVARGNVAAAAGLMLVLSLLSPVLSPGLLHLSLLPLARGDVSVDVVRITLVLLAGQIVPLLSGVAFQHFRAGTARRLAGPLGSVTKALNAVFLLSVALAHLRDLVHLTPASLGTMLLLVAGTIAVGWLLGARGGTERRTLALVTGARSRAVGMVIVTGVFPGTPAVGTAVLFALLGLFANLLLAAYWRRVGAVERGTLPATV